MEEEKEQDLVDSRRTTRYLHGLCLLDIDVIYNSSFSQKYIVLTYRNSPASKSNQRVPFN
jgi:hypothetical protein